MSPPSLPSRRHLRSLPSREIACPPAQVNCEDDLVRHYDRGSMLQQRYLVQDNSSCLRPPPQAGPFLPPAYGGSWNGTHAPCLAAHDLAAKEERGVCTPGEKMFRASGQYDGPDWDTPEAYRGGALPDYNDGDPALTGTAARVFPYGKDVAVKSPSSTMI